MLRKRIPLNRLPNFELRSIRRLSDDDLIEALASWKPESPHRKRAEFELRRREGRTARLALIIAFASLIASIAGIVVSHRWT